MFLMKGWEMFYAERKNGDQENKVFDELSIDVINKRFVYDKNVSEMVTKRRVCLGSVWGAKCIRSENLDMLVEQLKAHGYKELR